jgi:hypothetical protein
VEREIVVIIEIRREAMNCPWVGSEDMILSLKQVHATTMRVKDPEDREPSPIHPLSLSFSLIYAF